MIHSFSSSSPFREHASVTRRIRSWSHDVGQRDLTRYWTYKHPISKASSSSDLYSARVNLSLSLFPKVWSQATSIVVRVGPRTAMQNLMCCTHKHTVSVSSCPSPTLRSMSGRRRPQNSCVSDSTQHCSS